VAALHGVDKQNNGAAISLLTFFRTIGGAISVIVFGVIQSHLFRTSIEKTVSNPELVAQLDNPRDLLIPQIRESLPPVVLEQAKEALAGSISSLYLIGIALIVVAGISTILMGNARLDLSRKEQSTQSIEQG
jgi:hypothetical protein